MRALSILALLAACSDYELKPDVDPTEGPDEELPLCDLEEPEAYEADTLENCEREPEIGAFDPVVEWQWADNPVHPNFNRVETPPIVANLTDDNGDGVIDGDDHPDIVVTAFRDTAYNDIGALIAVDGATGDTMFSIKTLSDQRIWGISGVAVGDVDRDGTPDIFVATETGLGRVDPTGAVIWHTKVPTKSAGHAAPALGDVEGDGVAEIALGGSLINADGTVRWTAADDNGSNYGGSFLIDVDLDGTQELVAGGIVLEHDGSVRWDSGIRGWGAIGNFDADAAPEYVVVHKPDISLLDNDGTVLWTTNLPEDGGGPPTVADYDGDGFAEIGIACKQYYRVFEGDGTMLWEMPTKETSSGITGSAVFDFEGDGAAEVVYADEGTLWVFDGATGSVELEWTDHNSGTRFEYPTIADLDNDGSAEILVPHGRHMHGTSSNGFSIIGSADNSFAPARRIWNQHAYFITNIDDDGTVPTAPLANWQIWNNFRAANSMTPSGLDQPDLRVGDPEMCTVECYDDIVEMYVPIENGGYRPTAETTVSVERVDGDTRTVLEEYPAPALLRGDSWWIGPIQLARGDFGADGILIMVDPDTTDEFGSIDECIEDNNTTRIVDFPCDEVEAEE